MANELIAVKRDKRGAMEVLLDKLASVFTDHKFGLVESQRGPWETLSLTVEGVRDGQVLSQMSAFVCVFLSGFETAEKMNLSERGANPQSPLVGGSI